MYYALLAPRADEEEEEKSGRAPYSAPASFLDALK